MIKNNPFSIWKSPLSIINHQFRYKSSTSRTYLSFLIQIFTIFAFKVLSFGFEIFHFDWKLTIFGSKFTSFESKATISILYSQFEISSQFNEFWFQICYFRDKIHHLSRNSSFSIQNPPLLNLNRQFFECTIFSTKI